MPQSPLLGTWKLVSMENRSAGGKVLLFPNWVGTDQPRRFEINSTGDTLTIVTVSRYAYNTNEFYQILRTRLFESLPNEDGIAAAADAYAQAVDEARQLDLTTALAPSLRGEIVNAYPFHPAIRDIYARFRENPNFQQTRALIRIMRSVVSALWSDGEARLPSEPIALYVGAAKSGIWREGHFTRLEQRKGRI